jgi:trk system potassium uptake protein TrkH
VPVAFRLVVGLALAIGAGTAALLLPGVGNERPLTPGEAFFTATSALATTGLVQIVPGRDLSLLGQAILLALMQVGGVGFMVLAALALGLLGRRISLVDRLALRDSLELSAVGSIRSTVVRIVGLVLVIEGAGTLLLWWNWQGRIGDEPAHFYALFHAVSAFTNSGFDLFSGRPEYPSGMPSDATTLLVLAALIVLGGLGSPVLFYLLERLRHPRHRRLRTAGGGPIALHARITLVASFALIVGGTLTLLLSSRHPGTPFADVPFGQNLLLSFFLSVAARTSGFTILPDMGLLPHEAQFVLIVLMFVGAAPASMAGGITTSTVTVLAFGLWAYARGADVAHVGGWQIPEETVRRAGTILTVSLLVVCGATWLLMLTQGADLDEALFEAVSALSTCGYSLGLTVRLDAVGQAVVAVLMFCGRLGPLTLMIAFAQRRRRPRVGYPEARLLLG